MYILFWYLEGLVFCLHIHVPSNFPVSILVHMKQRPQPPVYLLSSTLTRYGRHGLKVHVQLSSWCINATGKHCLGASWRLLQSCGRSDAWMQHWWVIDQCCIHTSWQQRHSTCRLVNPFHLPPHYTAENQTFWIHQNEWGHVIISNHGSSGFELVFFSTK